MNFICFSIPWKKGSKQYPVRNDVIYHTHTRTYTPARAPLWNNSKIHKTEDVERCSRLKNTYDVKLKATKSKRLPILGTTMEIPVERTRRKSCACNLCNLKIVRVYGKIKKSRCFYASWARERDRECEEIKHVSDRITLKYVRLSIFLRIVYVWLNVLSMFTCCEGEMAQPMTQPNKRSMHIVFSCTRQCYGNAWASSMRKMRGKMAE